VLLLLHQDTMIRNILLQNNLKTIDDTFMKTYLHMKLGKHVQIHTYINTLLKTHIHKFIQKYEK